MKVKPKKAVIIIEDDEIAFDSIKSIISDDYPNDKQKYNDGHTFENFRKILQNALSVKHTEPDEPEKSRKLLLEELKSYCGKNEEPVYLIDFLLFRDEYDNSVNGIHFHKFIHQELYKDKKVPSLFITAAVKDDLARVKNYCEKEINDKQVCHYEPKYNDWNDEIFKKSIIDFIGKAQSKPLEEQKDEPLKLEDAFKND